MIADHPKQGMPSGRGAAPKSENSQRRHTMKRKPYDIGNYADEIYTQPYEDTREEKIEQALRPNSKIVRYRVKTIISGPIVESEIYPIWEAKRYAPPKPPKKKGSSKAQKNLNDKNARKKLVRLINANFTENDIWATFTYDEKHRPHTEEEALQEVQRYIKRLQAYIKRNNLPELKYIHIMEFNEDDTNKKKVRVHHHLIMNFKDRDKVEDLWKAGGRKNTRRLQPDDFHLEGLGRYLAKDPCGKRRWSASLNLTKPKVITADSKFRSVRQVEKMLIPDQAVAKITKLYPDFELLEEPQVYVNDQYGGYYIYTRMRRQI